MSDPMHAQFSITAAAALTPYGLTTGDFAEGFTKGPAPFAGREDLTVHIGRPVEAAAVPDYDVKKLLATRSVSSFDRLTRHLCVATEALHQALGFQEMEARRACMPDERVTFTVGTNGPLQSVLDFDLEAVKAPQYVQPGLFPNVVYNVPASYVGIRRTIRGSVITLTDGDSAALDALAVAVNHLKANRADLAIFGGAEELTPAYALHLAAQALTRGEELPRVSEGAILFSLEAAEAANRRGQPILADVLGVARVFCPDTAAGLAECVTRLRGQAPDAAGKAGWLCAEPAINADALGLAGCRRLAVGERLGHTGSLQGAAAILAALANPEIGCGETFLVLAASPEGACAATLLCKRAHLPATR